MVGGCSKTLRNGNSRGVGGSKVKNLPCGVGGGMDIFWNHTISYSMYGGWDLYLQSAYL